MILFGIRVLKSIGSPKALYNIGVAYASIGDHNNAYTYLKKAYEMGYKRAVYNLAVASLKLGKKHDAIKFLEEYESTFGPDSNVAKILANLKEK